MEGIFIGKCVFFFFLISSFFVIWFLEDDCEKFDVISYVFVFYIRVMFIIYSSGLGFFFTVLRRVWY